MPDVGGADQYQDEHGINVSDDACVDDSGEDVVVVGVFVRSARGVADSDGNGMLIVFQQVAKANKIATCSFYTSVIFICMYGRPFHCFQHHHHLHPQSVVTLFSFVTSASFASFSSSSHGHDNELRKMSEILWRSSVVSGLRSKSWTRTNCELCIEAS